MADDIELAATVVCGEKGILMEILLGAGLRRTDMIGGHTHALSR